MARLSSRKYHETRVLTAAEIIAGDRRKGPKNGQMAADYTVLCPAGTVFARVFGIEKLLLKCSYNGRLYTQEVPGVFLKPGVPAGDPVDAEKLKAASLAFMAACLAAEQPKGILRAMLIRTQVYPGLVRKDNKGRTIILYNIYHPEGSVSAEVVDGVSMKLRSSYGGFLNTQERLGGFDLGHFKRIARTFVQDVLSVAAGREVRNAVMTKAQYLKSLKTKTTTENK